ncbi:MAG: DNA polymerase I, partial [uncultured Gemmatimonadaceae bacterium]
ASVEEQWVGVENATERLGVPPALVTDYLALVGDASDNVPGVPGIGDKTARELVNEYGPLERILENVASITKKRPREALEQHADQARLSKQLVTIREDLDVELDLDALRLREPDHDRLRALYLELEFTSLAKAVPASAPAPAADAPVVSYTTVDTLQSLARMVARARKARHIAVDTETILEPGSPNKVDALRSVLVGISVATAPGEAYYLPLRHRRYEPEQGDLLAGGAVPADDADRAPTDAHQKVSEGDETTAAADAAEGTVDAGGPPAAAAKKKPAKKKAAAPAAAPASIAARILAEGVPPVRNLPDIASPEMAPLRALLEDPAVRKTAQNAKYDVLALRRAGVTLRGLDFDTMLASYVLDPGRRSHALDVLALEFVDHQMTSYEELCGRGRAQLPFDVVPVGAARDYSCEDADVTLRLRAVFEPQLETHELSALLRDVEVPLVDVLAEMEWNGIAIDVEWFRSLKERFERERKRVEQEIYAEAGEEFNINSNPQLRTILFEKL